MPNPGHGASGRELQEAVQDVAWAAHGAASAGAVGNHDSAAADREELGGQLSEAAGKQSSLHSELQLVWDTITLSRESGQEASQGLDLEEVEELVLAHLVAYPEFLGPQVVKSLFRQVSLGQGLLDSGDRLMDVSELARRMKPQLPKHAATAVRIAEECCSHLTNRSEGIAVKLLQRLDLDKDGVVGEDEFLKAATSALAVEVENVALTVGIQSLMNDESFADDFHMAMAATMGLCPPETPFFHGN